MTATQANATDAVREILYHPEARLLAIDLRGTLLRTPRVTALLPELASQGVPDELARSAQAHFDEQLRGPLQQRGDILDWTLFAATSIASSLASSWRGTLDVEAVAAQFHARYLRDSRRLIEPQVLRRAAKSFQSRCTIVADGPWEREMAALATCFGTPEWMPPLVSSQCLGVNKLTSEFFVRLGKRWGITPDSTVVIGDRWDKDLAIPGKVGCRGILIGSKRKGIPAVNSLEDVVHLLDERDLQCAA